jgi:ADP-dependent NAD(P)H-hydrate dehydratase / NAD(P)H-hydrate epimerase
VIIDAIFGTGFHGEPREEAARSIEAINSARVPVVAVDIPSGVNASTGEVSGACVEAATTVTFHGEKVGLAIAPGSLYAGRTELVDIGLEPLETRHARVTSEIVRRLPQRRRDGNKYRSGSVLVVGGAPGLTGAVCLAAEAAFRADAGYVTVCAPRESLSIIEMRLLEAVKRPLEEAFEAAERAGALALGPGLGRGEDARRLVRRLLEETDLPAVVDADGLFGFEPVERDPPTVLTPHSGELARLLEVETAWVDAHRLEAVHRALERFKCVVLLKGSETIVAAPGARTLVSAGTPRLATAGTGDVLTGIVGAFLAKGMEGPLAAATAARAHADAALAAPHGRGMVASDVIAQLPGVLDAAV